jgi:hypothetical protein
MMEERTMPSPLIFGLTEMAAERTSHEVGHSSEDLGWIPVMVLFGE